MSITPFKVVRKPIFAEAVQVTEENIESVAVWCGGTITSNSDSDNKEFIKIDVKRPLFEKQTQAHYGDWVLKNDRNEFLVYTDRAYKKTWDAEEQFEAAPVVINNPTRVYLQELDERMSRGVLTPLEPEDMLE